VGAVLAAFQKRIVNWKPLPDFKTGKIAPCRLSKLSVQLWEIFYPIGAKNLTSPVLKKSILHILKLLELNG
jgi:hypothetical protein